MKLEGQGIRELVTLKLFTELFNQEQDQTPSKCHEDKNSAYDSDGPVIPRPRLELIGMNAAAHKPKT